MKTALDKWAHLRHFLRRRRVILVAAGILVLAAGYGAHLYLSARPTARHLARSTPKPPLHLSMMGGTHTLSADGRKQLQMRFDSIRIRKKKVGLLRFGLIKEAVVKNAHIEIYRYPSDQPEAASAAADGAAGPPVAPARDAHGGWPRDLLSNDMLSSLAIDDVRGLSFQPVDVQLFENGRRRWQISARRATARHRPARIEFSRQVELWRPAGTIKTERLTLNLETGELSWPPQAEKSK